MSYVLFFLIIGLVMCLATPVCAEDKVVGDFSIPEVHPLDAQSLESLRAFVQTDAEAQEIAEEIIAEARLLLDAQPHPLDVIHYEGLVHTDPRRVATVAKLREMGDVARIVRYWQVTGDDRAVETLTRFIVAWTEIYRHTGNDVNENKFYPLLVAYWSVRKTMTDAVVASVDAWVEALGKLHLKAVDQSTHFTNRYAKSVRLLAICGLILDRPEWVAQAAEGVKRFVDQSLYADGSSLDLKRRDTLTYHGSALKPVMGLAMLLGKDGYYLYDWEGAQDGSIRKSVHYVVPYAMGTQVREEWRHSKIDLDRRRAEAGLEKYRAGRLYEPKDALELMALAHYFDPDLMAVVKHLSERPADKFPMWQVLINETVRARHFGHGAE